MLVIDDLDGATVERAGALAAREHAAARQVRPELPAGFDSAEVCAAALQRLCDREVARHSWRFGKAPLVRVLMSLRDELLENS